MLDNDAWSAVAELAASQHGCFTRTQAASNGIGRRRLATALNAGLVEPHLPRVLRFSGAVHTWRARVMAATLSTGGVASHRAAARLFALDGFDRARPEITVARGHMPAIDGFVLHRWSNPEPEDDHVIVDGIPCSSIAATLAQLGAVTPDRTVEKALDEVLRRGVPQAGIQATVERLHRPGPSGTGALLRILADERRSGRLPDSWFERLVQKILAGANIPNPVLQHQVKVSSGKRYRLDMAWPELAVGLECHSRRYHFGPLKEAADHKRDLALAGTGWEVLYMTWEHRKNPAEFLPLLAETLATRARQLRVVS
jgi:very-short-patch-repair endonuclease